MQRRYITVDVFTHRAFVLWPVAAERQEDQTTEDPQCH
jgi:hypothetical protein